MPKRVDPERVMVYKYKSPKNKDMWTLRLNGEQITTRSADRAMRLREALENALNAAYIRGVNDGARAAKGLAPEKEGPF